MKYKKAIVLTEVKAYFFFKNFPGKFCHIILTLNMVKEHGKDTNVLHVFKEY